MEIKETPYKFFLKHAGYSYDPKTETEEEGRRRCARDLAKAEAAATAAQADYDWEIDDNIDSSDFSDETPPWALWVCVMRVNGRVVQSLGGIDFGRDKEPWSDPYKRVVEAELALEQFDI